MKALILSVLISLRLLGQDTTSVSNTAFGSITAASSSCTATSCVWISTPQNSAMLSVQLSGIFSATVQFEQSTAGSVWVAATSLSSVTSATTTGVYSFNLAGNRYFRVRASAFSSGPVVVNISSSVSPPQVWTDDGTTVSPPAGRNVSITATVPAGAPSGSLAVGGSLYGDASNVTTGGSVVARLDGWSTTVNSQTCSTNSLNVPGARVSDNVVPGPPSDLGAGLMFMAMVTGSDVIQIRVCNPTAGNIATGSGNGWTVKIAN